MIICVESFVALLNESFYTWCYPWHISWVELECFGGKEVMVGSGDGVLIIVPFFLYIFYSEHFSPWIPGHPLPKIAYGGVRRGPVRLGDSWGWSGGGSRCPQDGQVWASSHGRERLRRQVVAPHVGHYKIKNGISVCREGYYLFEVEMLSDGTDV